MFVNQNKRNLTLLAYLGAVPVEHTKRKRKFNAELRHNRRSQDYRIAGLNGKRAMERRARQLEKQKAKTAGDPRGLIE